MGNDDEIVSLLRKHYDENMLPLPSKPGPKFERMKERLENPETLAETVAERLNKYHWKREEIKKSDLDGSRLAELDPRLSLAIIGVPEEKAGLLFKKLDLSEGAGCMTYLDKVTNGMNFVLLEDIKSLFDIGRHHEAHHVLVSETTHPLRKRVALMRNKLAEEEFDILEEILAYGAQWDNATEKQKMAYLKWTAQCCADYAEDYLPDGGAVSRHGAKKIVENEVLGYLVREIIDEENVIPAEQRKSYAEDFARFRAAKGEYDNEALPDGGIISRHMAVDISEKAASGYFMELFDDGINAFRIINKNLPFETVSRIVRSCESVNELVEWSKRYKEVPGVGQS